jgi:stage III sporulation protein AH
VKNLIKKNQLMITVLAIMVAIAGYLQFAGTKLDEDYLTTDSSKVADSGAITENLTADDLAAADVGDTANLEALDSLNAGVLDLSEEDLLAGVTDIASLDSDGNVAAADYLTDGMTVASVEAPEQEQLASVDGSEDTQLASVEGGEDTLLAEATPEEGEIPGEAVFTSTDGIEVLSEAKLLKEQTRAKNKETLLGIINSVGLTDAQKQEAVDSMVKMTEIAEKEAAAEILLEAKGFRDVVVSVNDNGVDVVVNAAELNDIQRAQIEDIVTRKTGISGENTIISTVVSME